MEYFSPRQFRRILEHSWQSRKHFLVSSKWLNENEMQFNAWGKVEIAICINVETYFLIHLNHVWSGVTGEQWERKKAANTQAIIHSITNVRSFQLWIYGCIHSWLPVIRYFQNANWLKWSKAHSRFVINSLFCHFFPSE